MITKNLHPYPRMAFLLLLALASAAAAECYPELEVVTPLGGVDAEVNDLARLDEGKYLVATTVWADDPTYGPRSRGSMVLLRYHPDGSLDSTFGTGGRVENGARRLVLPTRLVIQPDGKVLVAARYGDRLAVLRYDGAGTLDGSFGNAGVAEGPAVTRQAYGLALQTDGKIVAVGTSIDAGTEPSEVDLAVVRFDSNGTLDATFGAGGAEYVYFGSGREDVAHDVAVQPDGKIVVVGHSATLGDSNFVVLRFDSNGGQDPTFDGDGSTSAFVDDESVRADRVALQADGKIVVAGVVGVQVVATRFNADGTQDSSFGIDGEARYPIGRFNSAPVDLLLQPDGAMAIAASDSAQAYSYDTFAVGRINPDGTLDAAFGHQGVMRTGLGRGESYAAALALEPDGRLVAAGGVYPKYAGDGHAQAGLVRYPTNAQQCADVLVQNAKPVTLKLREGKLLTRKTVTLSFAYPDSHPFANPREVVNVEIAASPACGPLDIAGPVFTDPEKLHFGQLEQGRKAKAKLVLTAHAGDFANINSFTPTRCVLTVTAEPRGLDPMPTNNVTTIEVNMLDVTAQQEFPHESFISSLKPLKVTIDLQGSTLAKSVKFDVGNGDLGEQGHEVTVVASDGDCPSGTLSAVDLEPRTDGDQATSTVAGGSLRRGALTLAIDPAQFADAGEDSPLRCTATLTAVGPGGDTDDSNDTARLPIDVFGK